MLAGLTKVSDHPRQKLLDHDKQSATNALKTTSRRAVQKTAGATSNLLIIKSLIKLQKSTSSQNSSGSVTNKQKMLNLIEQYQVKDIYLQKIDGKLEMI